MPQPQLPRFEFTILKNKSISDPAQVPSSGTVQLRRQGATVNQSATIPVTINDPEPVPTTVVVYDIGEIRAGDLLQIIDIGTQNVLSVAEVLSPTSLSLLNLTQNSIALSNGKRLVVSGSSPSHPQFYSDPMGFVGIGSSFNADGASGRVGAYVRSSRFDFLVTPTGESARLYVDHAPRFDNPAFADVRSYGSIQAAIDALPPVGGTVYAPAANYPQTATIVVPRGKRIHLKGDGVGRTIISCSDPDKDILWVKGSFSTIEDLTIQGPNTPGKGRGIVLGLLGSDSSDPNDVLRRISVMGCIVTQTASWALYVIGLDEPNAGAASLCIWSHVERTVFRENKRTVNPSYPDPLDPKHYEGLVWVGKGCTTQVFLNSAICFFVGHGVHTFGAYRVSFLETTFEDKLDNEVAYATFDDARNVLVSGGWFENHQGVDTGQPFIDIGRFASCTDITIANPRFVRHVGMYPQLVRVDNSSRGIVISNPTCTMIEGAAADRFTTGVRDITVAPGSEAYVHGGVLHFGMSQSAFATSLTTPDALDDSPLVPFQRWSPADWSSIVDRTGTKDVNTWDTGDPLVGTLIAHGRQALYRIAAYLVSDPTNSPLAITVNIGWQDLEGSRSAVLLAHTSSTTVKTIASSEKVVLSAADQGTSYTITPDDPSVNFRVYLRAEAI